MSEVKTYRVQLKPIGVDLTVPAGTPLRDVLFDQGAEFPCGGQGRCRGCRVKVLRGQFAINSDMREHLTATELAEGWRLACQCTVEGDATIELRQWDMPILVDESDFAFTPLEGLGVAVDLGTTTLAAQLLDLATGNVLGVRTALNPQAKWGGDVMSRVQSAITDGAELALRDAIRDEIGTLIRDLLAAASADGSALRRVAIVGNTVMHHLFSGVSVEPLSHTPFEPVDPGLQTFRASDLGWEFGPNAVVRVLPCLGGFVGSDILAGLLATRLHESEDLVALVDLGTNGEIVVGNREKLLCASTAAGPAFEGARIRQGMRAATGAIWQVDPANAAHPNGTNITKGMGIAKGTDGSGADSVEDLQPVGSKQLGAEGRMLFSVLGGGRPRGICGSGLVDTVAVALDLELIKPSGRLADGGQMLPLIKPVALTQADVRELQLAKGAIAAGMDLLLRRWNATPEDVKVVYLAGAFGNYINRASAQRIGLINFPPDKVDPVGNTALLGAKIALFVPEGREPAFPEILRRVEHVSLNEEPGFQDVYADAMGFPRGAPVTTVNGA